MTERTIRLTSEAWALLWQYKENLQVQLTAKPLQYPEEYRGKHLTLSDAVSFLLRGRQNQTARQKRYQEKLLDRRYTTTDKRPDEPCTDEGPAVPGETPPDDVSSPGREP